MYHILPFKNASAYRRNVARLARDLSAPPSSPTPLALDAARLAEGAELGESCGVCGLTFHPDCAACLGGRAA